ncbi:hypothetical protein EVAR_100421_1 [Eumeta japonica]|uniref:Uncharacterized protein n=1 Tax=Eumeta variegata TaxID=151549 RepID=A0A4C1SNL6_EUMVA|nr:hypothetical protein EVAR_100421_1 [Eumeta japonica]
MSIDFDMVNCGSGTGYDYYTAQSMCRGRVRLCGARRCEVNSERYSILFLNWLLLLKEGQRNDRQGVGLAVLSVYALGPRRSFIRGRQAAPRAAHCARPYVYVNGRFISAERRAGRPCHVALKLMPA